MYKTWIVLSTGTFVSFVWEIAETESEYAINETETIDGKSAQVVFSVHKTRDDALRAIESTMDILDSIGEPYEYVNLNKDRTDYANVDVS